MQNIQHYDIAIIGSGITGLSTAYHLGLNGDLRICLSSDPEAERDSTSALSANMLSGGLIDNFTRIAQRHGPEKAHAAWAYSHHAYDAVLEFAREQGIRTQAGMRVRLIETEDELTECKKAVEQLSASGFPSRLEPAPPIAKNLLGQQIDLPKAAFIDHNALLAKLRELTKDLTRIGRTRSVTKESEHFTLTSDKETIHAELVIYANHLGLRQSVPRLADALVSSQDQWQRMKSLKGKLPFPVGSLITWRHGHYWAHIESEDTICMGGARFFRPLAGFEASEAELSEKVAKHLPEAWAKYFPDLPLGDVLEAKAGLDIRPCDEIPVIGPMFGESGVFLAGGYMGQGLSLGFKAGQSLAKIVLGHSDELPRFFWPERHRSLAAVSTEE